MSGGEQPIERQSYTLEAVLEITGVERDTVLRYCEIGVLAIGPDEIDDADFTDESIRRLLLAEHLRCQHGLNLVGVRMIMELTAEVERLREELRFQLES
ncbi:MAG TPA: hypothetical protein DCY13_08815 [Verrucomicrobiales bacterium]|nr:hypothetical protein [Verrucomicrobiales bacterium]